MAIYRVSANVRLNVDANNIFLVFLGMTSSNTVKIGGGVRLTRNSGAVILGSFAFNHQFSPNIPTSGTVTSIDAGVMTLSGISVSLATAKSWGIRASPSRARHPRYCSAKMTR